MEDVVAVEIKTDTGQLAYFVTWGRIQDAVDPSPLESLIMEVAARFAVPGTPVSARLCATLQEARDAPLFYEALISFAASPIPYGRGYRRWRARMGKAMVDGKEIYFVGPWDETDAPTDLTAPAGS